MHRFARRTLLPVVWVSVTGIASVACAAEPVIDTRQIKVRYDDLRVSTPAGLQTLELRVRAAARRVCSVGGTQPLRMEKHYRDCVRDAEDRAFAEFAEDIVAQRTRELAEEAEKTRRRDSSAPPRLICRPPNKPTDCRWK
jgi:UrcA family protein